LAHNQQSRYREDYVITDDGGPSSGEKFT